MGTRVGIPADQLPTIFPFHIAWNGRLEIVQMGAALRRLYPHLVGRPARSHLRILQPDRSFEYAGDAPGERITLEFAETGLRLQGLVIGPDPEGGSLFLGSPCAVDPTELRDLGFRLEDLPFHDGASELLPLIASKDAALADLKGHRARLRRKNRELTEAVEKLKCARDAAVEASELKSAFIANVSHEIRTPLNGVIGLTELVLDTDLTGDQRENLSTVKSSAESLLPVINDILDLSKIEAGKLEIETIPFPLRRMVREAIEPLKSRATAKGLCLSERIAEDVPDCVAGDPCRLRQVLTNLVGNAIKFTDQGSIGVQVQALRREAKEVLARFSVSDTGIGIPGDKQQRIFEAFRQADSGTARKYGGSGLGLSISSRLVGLMGGSLELSSEPGRGSTFWFTLPLGIDAPAGCLYCETKPRPDPDLCANCLAGFRILLAEDHPVNQKVAVRMLEKQGGQVTVAATGLEVLAALERYEFDVVLMDIQMPEMDGLGATAAIRASEQGTGRHVPIVAMTAHALKGDRERFLAAGMDAYISKPVRAHELLEAIQNCRIHANRLAPKKLIALGAGTGKAPVD